MLNTIVNIVLTQVGKPRFTIKFGTTNNKSKKLFFSTCAIWIVALKTSKLLVLTSRFVIALSIFSIKDGSVEPLTPKAVSKPTEAVAKIAIFKTTPNNKIPKATFLSSIVLTHFPRSYHIGDTNKQPQENNSCTLYLCERSKGQELKEP